MKKHAVGPIFFVFIVASFAVGYAIFKSLSASGTGPIDVPEVIEAEPVPTSLSLELKIVQAIVDRSGGSLVIDVLASQVEAKKEIGIPVLLTFYRVGQEGPQFVRSESVMIELKGEGTGNAVNTFRFAWIAGLTKSESLYVIARPVLRGNDAPNSGFEPDLAVPVLIAAK